MERNSIGFMIAVGLATACAATQYGATDANMANAKNAAPKGAALFAQRCAPCHGERGEGASAPRIMGLAALPEYPRARNPNTDPALSDPESVSLHSLSRPEGAPRRNPFRTAQDVYDFISTKMPQPAEAAGSLTADEYWSILNFLLLAHGTALPAEGVTPANASSIKL